MLIKIVLSTKSNACGKEKIFDQRFFKAFPQYKIRLINEIHRQFVNWLFGCHQSPIFFVIELISASTPL